jgi:hypothetical protein
VNFVATSDSLRDPTIRPPLRFIAIHGAAGLRRWQAECLRSVVASGDATLVATAIDRVSQPPMRHGWWQRLYDRLVTLGLDAHDFAGPADGALAVPSLDIRDIPPMKEIDFILNFGSSRAVPPAVQPRHGTWRIHLGDAAEGELPGSREAAGRARIITVAVVRTTGADSRQTVLHHATIKTRRSHRATLRAVLQEASVTCRGACSRLQTQQAAASAIIQITPGPPVSGPLRTMAGQLVRSVRRAIGLLLFKDIWTIGVLRTPVDMLLRSLAMPMPTWQQSPPNGEWHADPFPVTAGDETYLLFEKYEPTQRRGLIACTRLESWDAQSGWDAGTAIDLGCHMSYPAVFTYAGQAYCAPETHVLGGLRIFRMEADPWHWTQVAHVLRDMALIDSTLFEHGNLWWLMATLSGAGSDTDLHAWYAPSPFGPWTPHGLNPVKSDVRSSRPAGNLFRIGDRLYRPAQDCERGYGTAVVINQIIHLDPNRFVETAVRRFEAARDWSSSDGLHTFNVFGELVVIDAKRRVLRGFTSALRVLGGIHEQIRRGGSSMNSFTKKGRTHA